MVEIILASMLIIAISLALLSIKLLVSNKKEFSSYHIHDSKALSEQGIHCVMEQDKEMRSRDTERIQA